jgi:hypothetical protein
MGVERGRMKYGSATMMIIAMRKTSVLFMYCSEKTARGVSCAMRATVQAAIEEAWPSGLRHWS